MSRATPEHDSGPDAGVRPLREMLLIAFDEVALKRGQRTRFIERLRDNIIAQLGCSPTQPALRHGRLEFELNGLDRAEVTKSLERVFGIKWIAEAEAVPVSLEALEAAVLRRARSALGRGARSFKLEHSRKNKAFPARSQELNRDLGARVLRELPELQVDVHNPDLMLMVEIRRDQITVFAEKQPGPEGLPVGTTGSALALLSGGIDSPVAAWYAMKRGLTVEYIHFHSPPYTGLKAQEKVRDLVGALNRWSPEPARLFLVPFAQIQEAIAERAASGYWTILQRRVMQRIAGTLAERNGFDALVGGDSIGQVASQTLSNMAAIDAATPHLVLRPLLGFDKAAIVNLARRIGTYEISIRPFEDCCVLFAPRNPAIESDPQAVGRLEEELSLGPLLEAALQETERLEI